MAEIQTSDKILLYGDAGIGKSASLATIFKNPLEGRRLIYLMSEKNAKIGFDWGLKHHNISLKPGQVFFSVVEDKAGFSNLARSLRNFSKEKQSLKHDPTDRTTNADKYSYLISAINSLEGFVGIDYVTGESVKFGDVGQLLYTDILAIDGLSPIASECWKHIYGDVLLYSGFDYGPVQQLMYNLFHNLQKIRCNVVLLAHEKDYVQGEGLNTSLVHVGPDTKVGEANFKSLMGCMTEVIHAVKVGTKFSWEGSKPKVYTVTRKLPAQINLEPDFSKYGFFGG